MSSLSDYTPYLQRLTTDGLADHVSRLHAVYRAGGLALRLAIMPWFVRAHTECSRRYPQPHDPSRNWTRPTLWLVCKRHAWPSLTPELDAYRLLRQYGYRVTNQEVA